VNPALIVCTLVLLGSTAVRLVLSDEHLRYVKPSFGPFLLVAGIALCVLGVALGIALARADDDDPAVHHPGPRIGLLLLAPVAVVFVVAPPALGAYAAERSGVREPELSEVQAAPLAEIGPDGYRRATLDDYTTRAFWDLEPSYGGEPVALEGFVTPREGGGWYLTRIQIACCAADGSALKVVVRGGGAAPPADTWVRVEGRGIGTLAEELRAEDALGELVAEWVTEIEEPVSPYEESVG
jgi:uncharacterized repeat protein (TIGR03943 family)